MIKAVFFDFGGTLADKGGGYWSLMGEELAKLFGTTYERAFDFFRSELNITPVSEEMAALKQKCRELQVPETRADEFIRVRREYGKGFKWEKGAVATVKALKEKGLKVGMITNTDGEGVLTQESMRPNLGALMDAIVYSCEERVAKPDKRIFNLALNRAGVKAGESLYVGDKEDKDVLGAKAAGMKAVLYDPRGESNGSKADYVIKGLKQVLELVG